MTTYGFRLRYFTPESQGINHDGESLEILLPGISKPVLLTPVLGSKVKDADYLEIRGEGFNSEDDAYGVGLRIKYALSISCSILHIGIDLGTGNVRSGAGDVVKD